MKRPARSKSAKYVAKAKADLLAAGGRRISVNLDADAARVLEEQTAKGLTQSEVVASALLAMRARAGDPGLSGPA